MLPTRLWSRASSRLTLSRDAATFWSLHPLQLLEVEAPFRIWQVPLSGEGVLALALVGLRGRRALALGAVGAAAAAFALGRHTQFFDIALELVPCSACCASR